MRLLAGTLEENEDNSLTFRLLGADAAAYFPITTPRTVLSLRESATSELVTLWDVDSVTIESGDTLVHLVASLTETPAAVIKGYRDVGLLDFSATESVGDPQYALIGLDVGYNPNATQRSVRLTRFAPDKVNLYYYGAYRMRIEATEAQGPDMDPYVFIHQRGPVNPYTGDTADEFLAVAGPADMADIPPLEPDAERSWPFYRLDYVEMDFRNESIANEVWEIILREVQVLVEAMGGLTQLQTVETYVLSGPELTDTNPNSESE